MCGTPPSGAAGAVFGSAGSNPTVDLGDKDRTAVGLTFNADVNTTITSLGSHILNLGGDGIVKHGTVGRKIELLRHVFCGMFQNGVVLVLPRGFGTAAIVTQDGEYTRTSFRA